ncbi:unnamed protein product [Caenorhabditis angaria]|uniref:Uncharacterized protein n=1 Tax=Caenorhabditis angaria TaxID=860376 RepID=A0A9P1IHH3_9PELO|nr:unnamed protein product [Caenorhabditis angaria]
MVTNQITDLNPHKKYEFSYPKAMQNNCKYRYKAKKRSPIEYLLEDIQKNRPEQTKILEIKGYLNEAGIDSDRKKKLEEYVDLLEKRLERKNNVEELNQYLTGFPKILERGDQFCFLHHMKGEYMENFIYENGYDPFINGHAANGQMGYISKKDGEQKLLFGDRDKSRQKCRKETREHTGNSGSCVSYPELYDKKEYQQTTDDIFKNMIKK